MAMIRSSVLLTSTTVPHGHVQMPAICAPLCWIQLYVTVIEI